MSIRQIPALRLFGRFDREVDIGIPDPTSLSMLFPAHETMLDYAILVQETSPDDGNLSGADE
jgi:hypothetical protein